MERRWEEEPERKRTGKLASGGTKEGLLIPEQATSIGRTHYTWFMGRVLTAGEERPTLLFCPAHPAQPADYHVHVLHCFFLGWAEHDVPSGTSASHELSFLVHNEISTKPKACCDN